MISAKETYVSSGWQQTTLLCQWGNVATSTYFEFSATDVYTDADVSAKEACDACSQATYISSYSHMSSLIVINLNCESIDYWLSSGYGVALVSTIDKIVRLFCKRALQKTSAKETCNLIDPTNRSHPIFNFWQSIAMGRYCAVYV